MSNSKSVIVDGNADSESVHHLSIVPSEEKQGDGGSGNSVTVLGGVAALDPLNHSQDESENEKESHVNDKNSSEDDPLIGQRVDGIVKRKVEGQGCVITVRVGESDIYLRGEVFPYPRSQIKKKRRMRYII